jgi:hypothetical protein
VPNTSTVTEVDLMSRFRALDEPSRRRLACGMVRRTIAQLSPALSLPPDAIGLLATAGVATPAQLNQLDRQASVGGGPGADHRRSHAIAAARYALSPQPRAPEAALYEALHTSDSFDDAVAETWRLLH